MRPPITAIDMGERKLGSAKPQPRAKGSMPAPMAMVVMMMGRARLWQASIKASHLPMPMSRWATMAYSTNKMEFLVAMPISMINPIKDGMEKLLLASNKPTNAPPKDKGRAAKMVSGCKKPLNNSTSTM